MAHTKHSRRDFLGVALAGTMGCAFTRAFAQTPQSSSRPRRFVIDAHQHYSASPDYIERLVKIYRPRNAMACVLTPISGFEVVKKAAAQHPDVVIPYGHVSVDNPEVIGEIQKFADAGFKGIKIDRKSVV